MDDFAANASTTGVVDVGSYTKGAIDFAGDVDWLRVDLTAGSEYRIYLQGVQINSGTDAEGTLPMPMLGIRDSQGGLIVSNVQGLGDNAMIDFVAPTTGTYFLDVSSARAGDTGTYTLSVKPYVSLSVFADFLAKGFWTSGIHTQFPFPHSFDHTDITVNISALNATEQGLARAALALYASVSPLVFTEVSGSADITFSDAGVGVVQGGATAVSNGHTLAASVQISSNVVTSSALDSGGFPAYLHEIGHALGLGHPGPYNEPPINYGISNSFGNDSLQWTVMTDMGWLGQVIPVSVTTPQMGDIGAIQELYGANLHARDGNTIYGFNDTAGPAYDVASFQGGFTFTIYDTGGQDTLDASGFSMAQSLDLRPGDFSSMGGAVGNVGIYPGTIIEGAVGGAGADQIVGNDAGDQLHGGAGNDTITAGSGQNYLRGDDGNDSITGGAGFDDINGNKGDDTIDGGSGGGDWLVGGQGNDLIVSHASADILYGNLGSDTLEGGSGDEIIRGGQANDSLSGGAGNDWLSGDRGDDTISGGSGADVFHTFAGAGLDLVTDFNAAEGDRVQVDAGTVYTVSQSGADVVIDMGGGSEMILKNVQLASLPTGWIFTV